MTSNLRRRSPDDTLCSCRICLPPQPFEATADPVEARSERSCIDTVRQHGWQVMLVGSGACDCGCGADDEDATEPAFAYTVGLGHQAGHPELAMTGLPTQVMHHALTYVAEQVVRRGLRVQPGDAIEGALADVRVTVDVVSPAGARQLGSWSRWFHRSPIDTLQLVWPSTSGVFAWQPGGSPALDEAQPPSWRIASSRVGAFAADPPWPLPVAPDARAFLCTHVRGAGVPVLFVARQPGVTGGEDWSFTCGGDHGDGIDQMVTEHVAHVVRSAPSVRHLADLGMDEAAWRADAFSPWQRGVTGPEA